MSLPTSSTRIMPNLQMSSSTQTVRAPLVLPSHSSSPLQSSAVISSISPRQALRWIASRSNAMRQFLSSTRMPSATKVPSSPPLVPSSTFPARRPVVLPRTNALFTKRPPKMISGGVPSISRWMNVSVHSLPLPRDHRQIFPSDTFEINRERAIDYLNTRDNVYVFDGFAGVRVLFPCSISFSSPISLVGSQVPHQGPRHLCSCLPRSLHGTLWPPLAPTYSS